MKLLHVQYFGIRLHVAVRPLRDSVVHLGNQTMLNVFRLLRLAHQHGIDFVFSCDSPQCLAQRA